MIKSDFLSLIITTHDTCAEDQLKVRPLTVIRGDDDSVSLEFIQSVFKSCHVSGIVVVASVTFSNNEWLFNFWHKNANSSLIFFCMALVHEFLDNSREHVVIKRLSHRFNLDIKSIINFLELLFGKFTEKLPTLLNLLISSLKLNNSISSSLLELRVRAILIIESLLRVNVEDFKVSNSWLFLHEIRELIEKLSDQHAKLSTPVTQVVNSLNTMPLVLKDSAGSFSLESRSQVTHMHVLCDVGRGEIDDHVLYFIFSQWLVGGTFSCQLVYFLFQELVL